MCQSLSIRDVGYDLATVNSPSSRQYAVAPDMPTERITHSRSPTRIRLPGLSIDSGLGGGKLEVGLLTLYRVVTLSRLFLVTHPLVRRPHKGVTHIHQVVLLA